MISRASSCITDNKFMPIFIFLYNFPLTLKIARLATLTFVELLGRNLVGILSSLSIGKYYTAK